MSYIYKNITGDTVQVLLSKNELKNNNIKSMNICNIHASDRVAVDLYLYRTYGDAIGGYEKDTETKTEESYYLINSLIIPNTVTLQLKDSDLLIDYETILPLYDLRIKLDAGDSAVDIIINNKK
jgi:hypothetical protein